MSFARDEAAASVSRGRVDAGFRSWGISIISFLDGGGVAGVDASLSPPPGILARRLAGVRTPVVEGSLSDLE
jgi:hypothetical protein